MSWISRGSEENINTNPTVILLISIYIYYYYYYNNAFITRHTSGLKTCSEALTRHSVDNKVNIKISNYAQQLRTLLNS